MANVTSRAAALGAICGMRTMLGPAFAARMASPPVRLALRLMAAGELIVDKLPGTPSRLAPGPFVGRMLSGATVGYFTFREGKQPPWAGAAIGAASAAAGAVSGYYGRRALGKALHAPDPLIAVLEDLLALEIGRRAST